MRNLKKNEGVAVASCREQPGKIEPYMVIFFYSESPAKAEALSVFEFQTQLSPRKILRFRIAMKKAVNEWARSSAGARWGRVRVQKGGGKHVREWEGSGGRVQAQEAAGRAVEHGWFSAMCLSILYLEWKIILSFFDHEFVHMTIFLRLGLADVTR